MLKGLGLTASQESRLSPGRSEPVKRKAEGFRKAESGLGSLNGTAAALSVPVGRLRVRMDRRKEGGIMLQTGQKLRDSMR